MKVFFRVVIAIATIPVTFLAVLFVWTTIERVVGYRQVTAFIKQQENFVEQQLANPRVHSLSLTHDPTAYGQLLIQFDVDDKSTFLRIESVLMDETLSLSIPPRWDTHLRSNEDLGNNWGFAAIGMGELGKGVRRIALTLIMSVVVAVVFGWVTIRKCLKTTYSKQRTEST